MAAPTEKTNIVTAIVFDFETGGLDFQRSAATQISLHAVRLDTFEVMDKYSSYIYPYHFKPSIGRAKRKVLKNKYDREDEESDLMEYGEAAMGITGITMGQLYTSGKKLEEVCQDIIDFIRSNTFPVVASNRPFLVGQNPQFDTGFMQQIMLYSGLWEEFTKVVRGAKDFWGNFQPALLDSIILSQLTFDNDKSIGTWKLEAMAERLGVDLDDAHDADADVTATREILRVLTARMRSGADENNTIGALAPEKKEKLRHHFKI